MISAARASGSPRSRSAELGRLCPSNSKLRVIAVLELYLDDAGSHDSAVAAALAGYIGPAAEWELLEGKWNAFLQREGLKFYHTVDCAQAVKAFAGRSHQQCNELHREAVE